MSITTRSGITRIAAMVLAASAAFAIVGCAEGKPPAKKTQLPTEDDDKNSDDDNDSNGSSSKSPSSSNSEKSGELDPGNAPADPMNPETPADPPATDPPATDPPATPVQKSATCNATSGQHKSVTSMNYTLTGKDIKISRLTVEITNKDNRNKNDINFYVTPAGAAEKKMFNSGDILPNGATTAVPVPDTVTITAGSKVRIETNFDTSLTDPSGSCTMQL